MFRKKIYASCGAKSVFYGPGRKEFNPKKKGKTFLDYLKEVGSETLSQIQDPTQIHEGVIANFMASRFIHQANLCGFLPEVIPSLTQKTCIGVEGACGSGARAIHVAIQSVLAEQADNVFVTGFEIQNNVKAVYGADYLAGAADFASMRKKGEAFFFPGIFSKRAEAYGNKYGQELARKGMAHWYKQAITHARKDPKAQEYSNSCQNLIQYANQKPDPAKFLPFLNQADCSKITDGAASLMISSEEGLKKLGVNQDDAIEILSICGAEGNITHSPKDLTHFSQTHIAGKKALAGAKLSLEDIRLLEIHDCFSISAILSLEALGFAKKGYGPELIESGALYSNSVLPTNTSGGLCGFGHPVGASGVRQLVDLWEQLTKKAANQIQAITPYGMMVSMGGDDITVTAIVVKG